MRSLTMVAAASAVVSVSALSAKAETFTGSWDVAGFRTFHHVIEGRPGPVTLRLDAQSAADGDRVAIYRADPMGQRLAGWSLDVMATEDGASSKGQLILPAPPRPERVSRQPIVVVVENASGRAHPGEYSVTVE